MKKVLLPLLAIAVVSVVGCKKEGCTDSAAENYDSEATKDDGSCEYHNHATITFDEPMMGEVIPLANAGNVHVHIEVNYTIEGEEIEVKLHPEGDENDLIIDHDQHSHDNPIVFMQDVDLSSYAAGTEFHLEVKACEDHGCTESVIEDIHFELGQ